MQRRSRWSRTGGCTALLVALALAGCQKPPVVPPIVDGNGGPQLPGKVVWLDLITNDVAAAGKFYSELFGWQITPLAGAEDKFALIRHGGRPIGGIVYSEKLETASMGARWLVSLSVPDVDRVIAAGVEAGGSSLVAPFDLPNRGRSAILVDPQGSAVALLTSSSGDPADQTAGTYDWFWTELWAKDGGAAASYYSRVFGYTEKKVDAPGFKNAYTVMEKDGKPRCGIAQAPVASVPSTWLPYVKAEDPKQLMARAQQLGGKVYIAVDEKVRNGSVAILADPTGGIFGVQQWPIPKK